MKYKKWNILQYSREAAVGLTRESGLSPLTAAVLCARGVDTPARAAEYLSLSVSALYDPLRMDGMDRAVRCIGDALEKKEKIAVYGDYDVDGVTATCLLVKYLRSRGADCAFYIPDRLTEGYGLNREAIGRLAGEGARLLITVDTGITAVEEVEYARSLGMRVVVTDHHECKAEIPEADAVVNPKKPGFPYPFKELAGVGVAFKLLCALAGEGHTRALLDAFAELAAIGTVADVMPLQDENRIIVDYGIRMLAATKNPGLRALLGKVGYGGRDKRVTASTVSYILAPRINAAGRFGKAERAVELFLTESRDEAEALADELCSLNRGRQAMEGEIYRQAMEQLGDYDAEREPAIVLWGQNWHHGVIGIVASKIADRFSRPAVLISVDGGRGKGSGRSVRGFNLFEALEASGHLLCQYGGHELAAGLSIDESNLEAFRKELCGYAREHLDPEACEPALDVDCEVSPDMLTLPAVEGLARLEPHGMGNPEPCFFMRDLRLVALTPIGNGRHMRVLLEKDGASFQAVFFGVGGEEMPFVEGDTVDLAFSAEVNSFRAKYVQLILRDMRLCESEQRRDESELLLYREFARGDALTCAQLDSLRPVRDELVAVWRHVRGRAADGELCESPSTLCRRINRESRARLSIGKLLICLDVFHEFHLFDCKKADGLLHIRVLHGTGKADISGSQILARLRSAAS